MRKNIPHLVGLEESEVFSRANRRSQKYYSGGYLFYDYAWDYVHAPIRRTGGDQT